LIFGSVRIFSFLKKTLNFPSFPNQPLDFFSPSSTSTPSALLLPALSSAQDLPPGRCPALAAVQLLPTLSPRVPPTPAAAVALPRCLPARAPRCSRALAGRHLAARRSGRSRAHSFLLPFPSLMQSKRCHKPDHTLPSFSCISLSSSLRSPSTELPPHIPRRNSPCSLHPVPILSASRFATSPTSPLTGAGPTPASPSPESLPA
jgi:hypothetical protein